MVTIALKKSTDQLAYVSVSLATRPSDQFGITSRLDDRHVNLLTLNGSIHDSWKSVEAACLSGVAYATRLLKRRDVHVELLDVAGRCNSDDMDGFAVAAALAVIEGMGQGVEMGSYMLGEWELMG